MDYDSRRTGDRFLDAGSTPAYSIEIQGMRSMSFISIKRRESNGKAEVQSTERTCQWHVRAAARPERRLWRRRDSRLLH